MLRSLSSQLSSAHETTLPPWLVQSYGVLLLFYVAGSLGFTTDFAHIGIELGRLPLYIGEVCLAALAALTLIAFWQRRRLPFRWDPVTASLALLLVMGGVFLVAGWLNGYTVSALRDAALVYYILFFFFTLFWIEMVSLERALRLFWTVGLVAIVLGSGINVLEYLVQYAQNELVLRFGHFGHASLALSSWIAMLLLALRAIWKPNRQNWLLFAAFLPVFLVNEVIIAYRSILLSIAAAVILTVIMFVGRREHWQFGLKIAAVLTALGVLLVALSVGWGRLDIKNHIAPAEESYKYRGNHRGNHRKCS